MVVEQNGEMLFNKVIGENELCVFYFYLKTKVIFFGKSYIQTAHTVQYEKIQSKSGQKI